MPFYANVQLRSSGASSKGTPGQAMAYLQDDHDSRRETNLSQGEVEYIARSGEGWKREQEGGEIPLHPTGRTVDVDQEHIRAQFEYDCTPHYQPANGGTPTTGYKSITLTLPKEVSLYADGHRKEATEAMYKAVDTALQKAYPGKEISAVSAVHTRNQNGEVHYHVHALVSKFAKDTETGKWGSLNKSASYEHGRLKEGWTEGIKREFEKSFGLKINQRQDGKAVLTLKDGSTLEPLNRNSRRALEKEIAPTLEKTREDGSTYKTSLKLNVMDQRIYEVSAQDRGRQGWDRDAFEKAFPKEAKHLDRYEKRVETLKEVGYLNQDGRITQPFKEHAALKWGNETPQLQQIRSELHQDARKEAVKEGHSIEPKMVSQAIQDNPHYKDRVERLGVSEASIQRFDQQRDMGTARITPEQRELARLEKELQGLPRERQEAVRGVRNVHQMSAVSESFSSREKDLRSRIDSLRESVGRAPEASRTLDRKPNQQSLQGTPGKEIKPQAVLTSRVANTASSVASKGVQKALTSEAKEGSKEARQALSIVSSMRGGFRAISHIMPAEVRIVMTRINRAVTLMNSASGLLKQVRASMTQERVSELKIGLKAGLARKDPTAQTIKCWKGREEALATRTMAQMMGKPTLSSLRFKATRAMGQQGARLAAAEKPRPALTLSSGHEPHRAAMDTLNRRFEAYALKAPFTRETLQKISPYNLKEVLQVGKGAGAQLGLPSLPGVKELPGLPGAKSQADGNVLKDLLQFGGKGTGWASASPASVASVHTALMQTLVKVFDKALELHKNIR